MNKVKVDTNHCLPSCFGLTLTSYSKTENDNMENVPNKIAKYNTIYRKMFPFPSRLKGLFVLKIWFVLSCSCRLWMEKQIKDCKDLLWYPIIWQNHHGYCIKFLWHLVNNRWHHGTAYWLLCYKCNRNTLFWNKNHF